MPQWQKCHADDKNKFYIVTAVSDNMQPMKSKHLWILGFSVTSIKLWRISAFLPTHLSRPLKKQKVIVCDWWILIRFVCFCVSRFVAFELQCSVACFWKAQYLTRSCKFFIFFILKHGKFRFPRWNCSYTYTQIWQGENEPVHSCQHLHLQLLLVYIAAFIYYSNGLNDVTEKFKIRKCFWQRRSCIIRNSSTLVVMGFQ